MDIDIDLNVAAEAARRWQQRQSIREQNIPKLNSGMVAEVESKERIQKRLNRLSEHAVKASTSRMAPATEAAALAGGRALAEAIGFERVLGRRDFLGIDFLELALAVSRFVGRIQIRTRPGRSAGLGTGFMVSPRLLLTNNHVLPNEQYAPFSEVEFDYQTDRNGRFLPVVVYGLDPQALFLTNKDLDYTLVAVRERSNNGVELRNYGWSRLIGEQGKALLGDSLNIIQHPKGEPKQIVLRSNQLVDLSDNFAHYLTDTEPGSSGSPVYNDQWEVVALHHSGVPKVVNGNYIAKDGSVWREGMNPDKLEWVANEGVRVSSLVDHIRRARLSVQGARLRDEMFNLEPPHPLELVAQPVTSLQTPAPQKPDSYTWVVPIQVAISLGTPTPGAPSNGYNVQVRPYEPTEPATGTPALPLSPPEEEAISIDPDYTTRTGYNPNFLGQTDRRVPIPRLSTQMKAKAAINKTPLAGTNKYVLPYHHYSVVMNKVRRLAFFTAVNIDGRKAFRIVRETDKWILDPRIAKDEQTDNSVYYNNPLDRGHLVRRLDPAWGDTEPLAKVANDDTFHYTNAAPQHHNFNAGQTQWAGLEDYILDNADSENLKICVFTGPVFGDDDPQYRDTQLPVQYWKVVTMVKPDKKLSSTAYLLSQESLIDDLPDEAFLFGAYKTFQVPIHEIEALTDLDFGKLKDFDPIDHLESFGLESEGMREIGKFEDIVL